MAYLHALVAVLIDLWGVISGKDVSKPTQETWEEKLPIRATPADQQLLRIPTPLLTLEKAEPALVEIEQPVSLGTHTPAFVKVETARVFLRPVHAFDSVVGTLSYASPVTAVRHEGRFTQVECNGRLGWIHKDELVYDEALVFPVFKEGEIYDAYHSSTALVRAFLHDAFFAEELYLPLQSVEYVTYVLLRAGRAISWPAERPRLAGQWHTLLRGVMGIHVGLVPRTGSLIEYGRGDGVGSIGYIERVRPDGSITVRSVGYRVEGQFLREEQTEDAYREAGAIFITIT